MQRGRRRADSHSGSFQNGQLRAGHLLVVERDHIAACRERQQIGAAAVIPHPGARADPGRALAGVRRQHPESDAEADGSLACHAGELARAYHPDDWFDAAAGSGGSDRGRGFIGLIRHAP
jgi:hypothetical protein